MIVATVGHQMPFDRLIRALDAWAIVDGRSDLFAQVGRGRYLPRQFAAVPFLDPASLEQRIASASAVIAHAGMGTVITARRLGKPLLVVPRRADLGETRNDHQLATARHLEQAGDALVAWEMTDLPAKIRELTDFEPAGRLQEGASEELIHAVRTFLAA